MTSIFSVSSFFRNYVQGEERTLLEDISGEKEGADDSTEEGTEGLTQPGIDTGSFSIRKKKSSPCGPYFPGTFHSMDAVGEHTLSIGSK